MKSNEHSTFFDPKIVEELTKDDFQGAKLIQERHNKEGYAVVMFYASYCGHCHRAKPQFEEFASISAYIPAYGMNGPENSEVKESINIEHKGLIQGWPTILFFKDGSPVYSVPPHEEARTSSKLIETSMKITGSKSKK